MPNPGRTILGILSVLPLFGIVWVLVYVFTDLVSYFIELDHSGMEPNASEIFARLGSMIISVVVLGLLHFGLLLFFIIHLMQDLGAKDSDRLVWLLLLLFFNPFSYPFYWYFRIYNDRHMSAR
jgi:hypothetical protein